jgi:hypothetical protein
MMVNIILTNGSEHKFKIKDVTREESFEKMKEAQGFLHIQERSTDFYPIRSIFSIRFIEDLS